MDAQELVQQLLAAASLEDQKRLLQVHAVLLDDQVADALKGKADRFLRADLQRSLATAHLILYLSELTHSPSHQALGLLAEANARSIGLTVAGCHGTLSA